MAEENELKLRATGSLVEIAYDRAFGAKPVSVAWNETYLALKEGLVDGMMIGYTDFLYFMLSDAVSSGPRSMSPPSLWSRSFASPSCAPCPQTCSRLS